MKYKKNKKDLEVEFSKEAFATLNLALELMSRTFVNSFLVSLAHCAVRTASHKVSALCCKWESV